ncbi:MAG: hypothetical protein VX730_07480 [Pseudomonadota bacterium]|nr:hypothetical protein [Pseudomonadota bacterium]
MLMFYEGWELALMFLLVVGVLFLPSILGAVFGFINAMKTNSTNLLLSCIILPIIAILGLFVSVSTTLHEQIGPTMMTSAMALLTYIFARYVVWPKVNEWDQGQFLKVTVTVLFTAATMAASPWAFGLVF